MPFGHSFGIICRQMIPLLILPFVLAMLLSRFLPRVHHAIKKRQELSFYMWSVALATVTGNTVSFLMRQDASNYRIETIMALLALVVCGLQFITGRRIGRRSVSYTHLDVYKRQVHNSAPSRYSFPAV